MPSSAVGSILKSPVMMTVPTGVRMAKETASAIEWFTWMNSIEKQPALTTSPGWCVTIFVFSSRPCSSSLSLMRPSVSGVACTGALTACST